MPINSQQTFSSRYPGWKTIAIASTSIIAGGALLGSAVGIGGAAGEWVFSLPAIAVFNAVNNALDARPAFRTRLAKLFGFAGAAVADQAVRDVESGVWGRSLADAPTDLSYSARLTEHGWQATAVHQPPSHGVSAFRAKVHADGSATVSRIENGKLQHIEGCPSVARLDDEGRITAAGYHDQGVAVDTWRVDAGQPLELELDAKTLAGECWMLASEIRYDAGHERIAAVLDRIFERCMKLADAGIDTVPVVLDGGQLNLEALDRFLTQAVANLDSPATPRR